MPLCEVYLGIDIGTTGVKATLITKDWRILGQRKSEYSTYQIKPLWVEQNPWDWWLGTCQVVKEVQKLAGILPRQIKAICVSSQAPSLLGIDSCDQPLGNALIWMDRRSGKECMLLKETFGDSAIRNYSGNRIDPYYMLPKLLWEAQHQKEKYNQTDKYIQANGWIILQLTGKRSIDRTHAALTQLYNIYTNEWETSLMNELGISTDKFPEVFECMDIVGGVSAAVAQSLGLQEGTPVVAGAIDGATAPLGLKLIENHQAFEMSGQSSGIGIVLDEPVSHPNLTLLKHVLEGKWILKGSMSTGGGSLQWFRDQIDESRQREFAYEIYEKWVQQVSPGSNGLIYLPYLTGERAPLWDSNAKGVFFGLHLQTGKAEMVRAIMEGTAFGLKDILIELQKENFNIKKLFGTGGGYLSKEWSQIKADILETEIGVVHSDIETGSLGAAYLALMSVTGLQASAIPNIRETVMYTPKQLNQKIYRNYYAIFKKLYENNKELFQTLSMVGEDH